MSVSSGMDETSGCGFEAGTHIGLGSVVDEGLDEGLGRLKEEL